MHFGGAVDSLRPDGAIGPELDALHRSDGAGFDVFADEARALHGVALVSHLRRLLWTLGRLVFQGAHLAHRAGQGLLTVDVLSQLEGHHGCRRMVMVGGRHHHGVDAAPFFGQQLAIVGVALCLGPRGEGALGASGIHVTEEADVLARHPLHVVETHAAHADAGHVERVRRRAVSAPKHVTRNDGEGGQSGGDAFDGSTARDAVGVAHAEVSSVHARRWARFKFVRRGPARRWPDGRAGRR